MHSSCGGGLKSTPNVFGYPHNGCATIKLMGTSCHASHYSSSQASQMGIIAAIFPLAACIVPSSTMKYSRQGGSFLVGNSLVSPCAVTKVCGVFSNRVYHEVRAMIINTEHGLGSSFWDTADQEHKGRYPVHYAFYMAIHAFWAKHYSLCRVTPITVFYLNTHTHRVYEVYWITGFFKPPLCF